MRPLNLNRDSEIWEHKKVIMDTIEEHMDVLPRHKVVKSLILLLLRAEEIIHQEHRPDNLYPEKVG